MADLPPAGWYEDPRVPGQQRWWDGTQWSMQHIRPVPVTAVPDPQATARQSPAARSWQASDGRSQRPEERPDRRPAPEPALVVEGAPTPAPGMASAPEVIATRLAEPLAPPQAKNAIVVGGVAGAFAGLFGFVAFRWFGWAGFLAALVLIGVGGRVLRRQVKQRANGRRPTDTPEKRAGVTRATRATQ